MQNITLPPNPASALPQTQSGSDNASDRIAEPFNNVLARQLSDHSGQGDPDAPASGESGDAAPADLLLMNLANDANSALPIVVPAGSASQAGNPGAALQTDSGAHSSASRTRLASGTHPATPLPAQDTDQNPLTGGVARAEGRSPPLLASAGSMSPFTAALEMQLNRHPDAGVGVQKVPLPPAAPPASVLSQSVPATDHTVPVQATLATPLPHASWAEEFSQQVTWVATQNRQSAELHLNPPHLGPIDVVINMEGTQATAAFTSPHAAVRDAIEQALPRLREMMAGNGIMLGNATVSDQAPGEHAFRQSGQNKPEGWAANSLGRDASGADDVQSQAGRRHSGMVDTYA